MHPKPHNSVRRRSKPVTLIIGIKCKDAVILASDSQISNGTSRRTDSAKMETVTFGGHPLIVAQSGDLVLSNRYVDIFSRLAEGASVVTGDEIGACAQKAMLNLRMEIREQHFGISSQELDDALLKSGSQVAIMIGFFYNKTPHLITISLSQPIYRRSRFHYEAEGCGDTLGNYLLAEHTVPNMEKELAATLAVYVVETVKRFDHYCGGPTRIGILREEEDGTALHGTYHQADIDRCAARLLAADNETKPMRLKKFHEQAVEDGFKPNENFYLRM